MHWTAAGDDVTDNDGPDNNSTKAKKGAKNGKNVKKGSTGSGSVENLRMSIAHIVCEVAISDVEPFLTLSDGHAFASVGGCAKRAAVKSLSNLKSLMEYCKVVADISVFCFYLAN